MATTTATVDNDDDDNALSYCTYVWPSVLVKGLASTIPSYSGKAWRAVGRYVKPHWPCPFLRSHMYTLSVSAPSLRRAVLYWSSGARCPKERKEGSEITGPAGLPYFENVVCS
jgi:hypothetical protein